MRGRIYLYPWELDSMPDYSLSLPSGTTLWKMWRRDANTPTRMEIGRTYGPDRARRVPEMWMVGQYAPDPDPRMVAIRWFKVVIKHGPAPRNYKKPDWSNFERYRRESKQKRVEREAQKGRQSAGVR